jgi:protein-tyrosine kinase
MRDTRASAIQRPSLAERAAEHLAAAPQATAMHHSLAVQTHLPALPAPILQRPIVDLDLERLEAAGYIFPDSGPNRLIDELRIIKRQLLAMAFPDRVARPAGNAHVILVTSAFPGEGKSFVAFNLALCMSSELERHILLIDADSARHTISSQLGLSHECGLMDLLTEGGPLPGDAIWPTSIPRLSFLPPGTSHPHASELLASRHMGQVMSRLASAFRNGIIIIDSPPVLHGTEAATLSMVAGQTVVVVETDRTTKRALSQTLSLLGGCQNRSCVLNMAPTLSGSDITGYGHSGYG